MTLVVVNDVLVLRRTTGENASHYINCAEFCLLTFVITGQTSLCLLFEQLLIRRIVYTTNKTLQKTWRQGVDRIPENLISVVVKENTTATEITYTKNKEVSIGDLIQVIKTTTTTIINTTYKNNYYANYRYTFYNRPDANNEKVVIKPVFVGESPTTEDYKDPSLWYNLSLWENIKNTSRTSMLNKDNEQVVQCYDTDIATQLNPYLGFNSEFPELTESFTLESESTEITPILDSAGELTGTELHSTKYLSGTLATTDDWKSAIYGPYETIVRNSELPKDQTKSSTRTYNATYKINENVPDESSSSTIQTYHDELYLNLAISHKDVTEKDAIKAYSARVKKCKYLNVGKELSDIYGVDICPIGLKVDEETGQSSWVLDPNSLYINFTSLGITTQSSTGEVIYNDINGTIERINVSGAINDYHLIDRKYVITTGMVEAGLIQSLPASMDTLETLYTFNATKNEVQEVRTINDNIDITYDSYYYKAYRLIMEKQAEAEFVSLITADENNKLALKFFMPVIPVSSPTIYTSTINFLNVMQDPNFNLKYNTLHLEKIIDIDSITGEKSITTNNFKLSRYNLQNENVDSFYYNFAIDSKDLWSKLGFVPCQIQWDRTTVMSYNSTNKADESESVEQVYPIYTIKGVYYSETPYMGPIYTPTAIKLESFGENIKTALIKRITLPSEYNIIKLLATTENTTLFNTYFNKSTHYAQRLMNLSIPKTIEVKMTQNNDIEEFLNSNEIVDSIANIGQYQVVRDNQTTIAAIQQQLVINSTIEIPDEKPIYVFLTNGNQIYSLMDTVATLNVEYIN